MTRRQNVAAAAASFAVALGALGAAIATPASAEDVISRGSLESGIATATGGRTG